MEDDELYPCVGICMVDDTSGLCMGCGRPMQEPAPLSGPAMQKAPAPAGERPFVSDGLASAS